MTELQSGLSEFAGMTEGQLVAKAEDLRQLIDALRDELDDVEAELDRRDREAADTDRSAA